MNPLTVEWIEKAEGDYTTALREFRARNSPNYDAACFHAQQMAEKYLKAFLHEHGIAPPRVHDLIEIQALCLTINPAILFLESDLKKLNAYSVQFRYPGYRAEKMDAKEAVRIAKMIRKQLRNWLGLDLG